MSHPLDAQNELERKIQLEGNADPDHFKMPDGRTLTEVRNANEKEQKTEYEKQTQAATDLAREQSLESRNPIRKPVMDETGTILTTGIQEKSIPDNPKPANPINMSTESFSPRNL